MAQFAALERDLDELDFLFRVAHRQFFETQVLGKVVGEGVAFFQRDAPKGSCASGKSGMVLMKYCRFSVSVKSLAMATPYPAEKTTAVMADKKQDSHFFFMSKTCLFKRRQVGQRLYITIIAVLGFVVVVAAYFYLIGEH